MSLNYFIFVKCCRRQNVSLSSKSIGVCKCIATPQEEKIGIIFFSLTPFVDIICVIVVLLFECSIDELFLASVSIHWWIPSVIYFNYSKIFLVWL